MKYIIDTADKNKIDEVLKYGINGITANPSMYKACNINLHDFISLYSKYDLDFLSGEVIGNYEDMLKQAENLIAIYPKIVIKINFSKDGLKLCNYLKKRGVKTAITLIFNVNQALAAIQAGADYIFPFLGRNDENGDDGLKIIENIQSIITNKKYDTKVVAASIKNIQQLTKLALINIDFSAIPYDLFIKSLYHPLTISGKEKFESDWKEIN